MPELGSYGSVRGAVGNSRPYRKCRPHADGAARTGAGVRKPPMEETAGGVARWRVRRYGDFDAGGLLARCVEGLFGKRSRGRRTRSADRNRQTRRRAADDGYRERREGKHDHCQPRGGAAEVQHWDVASNLI